MLVVDVGKMSPRHFCGALTVRSYLYLNIGTQQNSYVIIVWRSKRCKRVPNNMQITVKYGTATH